MSSLITKLVWYSLLVAKLVVAPPEVLESVRVCLEANEFRESFHLFPKVYVSLKLRVFSFIAIDTSALKDNTVFFWNTQVC